MPEHFDVTIITPTIGRATLERTIDSLLAGLEACRGTAFEGLVLEHLVVVDGPEPEPAVRAIVERTTERASGRVPEYRPVVLVLPYNTGRSAALCRALGATLARGEFVGFLDDDNWLAPRHLELCLGVMREHPDLQWMHTGRFMLRPGEEPGPGQDAPLEDLTESLGLLHHHAMDGPGHHMVDTNCYFLTRRVCHESAPFWHLDPLAWNWGEDRVFFSRLAAHFPRHAFLFVPTVFYVTSDKGHAYVEAGNARVSAALEPLRGRLHLLEHDPEVHEIRVRPAAFPDSVVPLP